MQESDEIALPRTIPPMGFIIVRHVTSKQTDYYWKEAYTCIRKWYDHPILIVDDGSNEAFLNDNMNLVNCEIVYDTEWKGCGEILGYYYFHTKKPFETAVILHDSVFIQQPISFALGDAPMRLLWTIPYQYDRELESYYCEMCKDMPIYQEFTHVYGKKAYRGCFGVMSVIQWDFLELLVEDGLFMTMKHIKGRDARSALERIIGIMAFRRDPTIQSMFGDIYSYTKWGGTFLEYLSKGSSLDVVKVWTGR
jgi:hypothetical protein